MRHTLCTAIALIASLLAVPVAAEGYPVEITHRFGTAEITEKPARIVSLSYIGHDFLLALDEVPIALRRWYGTDPYGVWPWGYEALGDATPIVMQGEIDIEQIAMLEPDLIVGQWSGMTEREYALLSQIAPTIAPAVGESSYSMSWPDMLRTLARATDTEAKAESIITRIETRFADLRATHPEWQGATAVMVWSGQAGAFSSEDIRAQLLTQLGFAYPQAVDDLATADNFYVLIPPENLDPIDTDVLVWLGSGPDDPALNRMPLRRFMRANRDGREVYADPMLSSALSHSSPLSIDYALDRLVPMIEAASDGDPTTVVKTATIEGEG